MENSVGRNRKDAEGAFLRQALGDDLFITSAGYKEFVSAGGRFLGHDPEEAMEKFRALPESERAPGAVTVPDLTDPDTAVAPPEPPANGLVLRAFGRLLASADGGALRRTNPGDYPLMAGQDELWLPANEWVFESHPDFVWIKEAEWKALVPAEPAAGDRIEAPRSLALRLCRFHLLPQRTYGEGGEWHRDDLRRVSLTFTVEEVTPDGVRMRIGGSAHMGSDFDAAKATVPDGPLAKGYEPTFDGVAFYDVKKRAFTRFDFVALGDTWGRMGDANGKSLPYERPGRSPLGFAFELADPANNPADRLIPAGRSEHVRSGWYWEDGEKD